MERVANADRRSAEAPAAAAGSCPLHPDGDMWALGREAAVGAEPMRPRVPTRPARGRADGLGGRAWILSLAVHAVLFVGAVFAVGTQAPRSAPLRSEAFAQLVTPEARLEPESPTPPPDFIVPG